MSDLFFFDYSNEKLYIFDDEHRTEWFVSTQDTREAERLSEEGKATTLQMDQLKMVQRELLHLLQRNFN